ncbi:site-2 protease family protein [candidate division KSB1 bacterium]|nr:site-2 protease family protein [candidate division KSB1 bacterium]
MLLTVPPILVALTIHEFSHGYAAYRLGDPTAKSMGRLTLNPLAHLDLIGTIALLLVHFGWAKPVPVNPNYFQNPRKDLMWTALAGPGANFLLAITLGLLYKFSGVDDLVTKHLDIQPVLIASFIFEFTIYINILLGVFNLIPIPPLDGSNILAGLLPPHLANSYASLSRYGIFLLLAFIAFGRGILQPIMSLFLSLYKFLVTANFHLF